MLSETKSEFIQAAYGFTYPKKPIFGHVSPFVHFCFDLKVWVVHYWGSKNWSRQIGSKLKFYLSTSTFWFQIGQNYWNRTINKKVLLHNHFQIFGLAKFIIGLLVKNRQFWSDFNVFGHFGIRRYWLINRILILRQSDDFEILAPSSERPGL